MTRKYFNYKDWEDYQNGLYKVIDFRKMSLSEQEILIDQASKLLMNKHEFYEVASKMVKAWPIAAEHHLTDTNSNRRAWIGQASCCFDFGVCDQLTKIGWHRLNKSYQNTANGVAEKVIFEWEDNYKYKNQLSIFNSGHAII